MNSTIIYHTPYRSEAYLDAISNLSLMGYGEIEILVNVIQGIHEHNPLNYKTMWIQTAIYDFPFEPEDMTIQNWEEFLTHYYTIIENHIHLIVKPFNITPRMIVVANINYEEMVIDYVF